MMTEKTFHSIGFIGGGRVTRFLLEGWQQAGYSPGHLRVSDPETEVIRALQADFPALEVCRNPDAARSDLVFLAVHPPVMGSVLNEIAGTVSPSSVVVSLAPKFTISKIASILNMGRIVRMIPNAPSAIGRGYNPVAYAAGLLPSTVEALSELFSAWGVFPEVKESELEAYAMIVAMGPTYMWFQWEELRRLAREFGLSALAADQSIHRMIEGAVQLLFSGKQPRAVMDMIPVEPLKDEKEAILEAYRERLVALYRKLTN